MADFVISLIRTILRDDPVAITPETALVGAGRVLDSLGLVELCLALEDKAAEIGFEFDWTSDDAMSRSRSIFLSVQTLNEEFLRQQRQSEIQ